MPGGKALTTGWREVHRLLAAGYDRRGQDDEAGAGAAWLKAWSLLLKTMDESGVARLAEIGPLLPEGISINKWVPDVHMTLWNAGLEAAHFHEEGVRFTTEFLRRFEGDDMGLTRNVRCALASLHAHLGRFETADALFGAWLSADPRWGWGWLRWAGCYSFRSWEDEQRATRGVEILSQGVAVQGVEHLKHLLAHLEVLLGDLGRDKEARAVRRRLLGLTEGELKDEESHHPCDLASWRAADRLILDGYDRSEAGDEAGACRLWLAAWPSFLQALDEGGIRGIDDFDEQVSGYGYVQEWTGDLANEIFDAAQQDRQSLEAGLRFTTEFLRRFEPDAKYLIEDVRRAHGLLHASAGRLDEADALYRRWLAEDPRWGWGWINWSACYTYGAPAGLADDDRAIEILQQGAVVPGLRDARDVLEELADHLSFAGREAAAEEVRRRRALLPEAKPDEEDLHDEAPPEPAESAGSKVRQEPIGGEPRRAAKVGRNQQCPCGSGKKFKKCCGR